MDSIFRLDGTTAVTSPNAAGPWGPMQHGGAPAALIVKVAEATPALAPMRIARLTIDLMRPVPLAPLTIDSQIVREGKKLQLLSVRLLHEGTEVVRASVLRLRRLDTPLPPEAAPPPIDLPGPDAAQPPAMGPRGRGCAFNEGVEMRRAKGAFGTPGPAAMWIKVDWTIIAGEPILPVMRAAIAGDYCNGTSAWLDFNHWTFINADLQLSFARDPVGEWVLLDAETYPGPDGAGVAFARLGDSQGWFGRAAQSVLFEKR
ncbi:hypothetical protein sos41_25000 [Alphaproteobacteria bacterium SO-S41]|nr:hypothetical protein sos41_25000 [Alphaproteobacteria bacterium SO-S41]